MSQIVLNRFNENHKNQSKQFAKRAAITFFTPQNKDRRQFRSWRKKQNRIFRRQYEIHKFKIHSGNWVWEWQQFAGASFSWLQRDWR